MRACTLCTTISTIAVVACAPAVASAASVKTTASAAATGGTTAAPATSGSISGKSSGGAGANKKRTGKLAQIVLGPHAPITAKSQKLEYKGRIFEVGPAGTVVPYVAPQPANTIMGATGGDPVGTAADTKPQLLVPGSTAQLIEGQAAAPMAAPADVKQMIWAANEIVGDPYVYGGGHGSFKSAGYDCSGTVSYALHGASLIKTPMDSSEMMHWGEGGIGRWVTIFSNPGHAYMTIAGLRLDTSPVEDPIGLEGPEWRPLRSQNPGFVKRHPETL